MITPVILCGGAGTRLWPLSRKSFPKQFAPLVGDGSLFQQAALRLSGDGFGPPLVVTADSFRFIVTEQLDAAGVTPGAILIEPQARNTAPAVLAAALSVEPGTMLLVAPSDHLVADPGAFRAAVARGIPAAQAGQIVTFGIRPTRSETGYGYLELASPAGDGPVPLLRFVEKPDADRARVFVQGGRHLWNAGIFLATAQSLIDAFAAHAPEMLPPVRQAVATARRDLSFLRLAAEPWAALPARSIDVAVMERATNLSAVPYDGAWSDLGGWDAVWAASGPDEQGVVAGPGATAVDCRDTLLRSESVSTEIVGIGLTNIVAIATSDAVLVADASRAQEVRLAVAALQARGAPQAETFPTDHRPWGWFETLVLGDRFRVKRIHVHPGAALSLQSHVHRAEHWIVVEGTARVTVGDDVRLVTENQSVYVPLGEKHRLENPGKLPMVLIEVQTGSYLGEDDIVRYDDVYAR
jgi:mannose-1-phosphate guanylyltransferase/mannose-1-phosphate guanylyltransferase/mannose-6-phosphate isomerase